MYEFRLLLNGTRLPSVVQFVLASLSQRTELTAPLSSLHDFSETPDLTVEPFCKWWQVHDTSNINPKLIDISYVIAQRFAIARAEHRIRNSVFDF